MKLKTFNRISLMLTALLFFSLSAFYSCKKIDTPTAKQLYAEKFFKQPAASSPELQAIIDLLKNENEKSGFVNTLPDGAGLPVWNRLIIEKPKPKPGYAARGIIADKEGNMLIPLSNDNKTMSALLFAIKKDKEDKYQFYYYDNNYAYGIAFSDKYTIKEREKVMGLFMSMSNYTFGIQNFKSIPKDLFADMKGGLPEEGDLTNKIFLVPPSEMPPVIFTQGSLGVIGTNSMCFYAFSGTCSCFGNSGNLMSKCTDWWEPCPQDVCTTEQCLTMIVEETPGTDSPDGNPNGGAGEGPGSGLPGWSNGTGDGGMLPTTSTGSLPNAPCNNCAWYTEMQNYEFDPTPPVIPTSCKMSCEEAQQALNAVTVIEAQNELEINYGSESVDLSGIIRKPVAPVHGLVSFSGWGSTPIHYSAYFQGIAYKRNTNDTWKWESCTYNYTALDGGTLPPCFEITHTVNVSPIVISTDKLDASAYINFQFYARAACLLGLTDPQLIHSGGNRTYHIPMGN